jgi:hypothetical protein
MTTLVQRFSRRLSLLAGALETTPTAQNEPLIAAIGLLLLKAEEFLSEEERALLIGEHDIDAKLYRALKERGTACIAQRLRVLELRRQMRGGQDA